MLLMLLDRNKVFQNKTRTTQALQKKEPVTLM